MAGVLPWPVCVSRALVLRAWPAGEHGTVASLLAAELGPVRVLARGARRPRSRLGPLVQPGCWIEAEHTWQAGRELQYLRGGEVVQDLLAGASLEGTAYLLAALELVDRGLRAGVAETGVYDLCRRWLGVLSSSATTPAAVFYRFELLLLTAHGVAPDLDRCQECGAGLRETDTAILVPSSGGCICLRCAGQEAGRPVPGDLRQVLRRLADPAAELPDLPPDRRRAIGVLLHRLLEHHLPGYRLPAALELLRPRSRRPGPDPAEEG